jgi:hypothetical protein
VDENESVLRFIGERKRGTDVHSGNLASQVAFDLGSDGQIVTAFTFSNDIRQYDLATGDLERVITRRLAFDPIEPRMEESTRPSPDGREVQVVLAAFVDPVTWDVAYDPAGRIWTITSLVDTETRQEREADGEDEGLVCLEVFAPDGDLLASLPLSEPADQLAFDPAGDLWLLDSLLNNTLRRYEVIWPE